MCVCVALLPIHSQLTYAQYVVLDACVSEDISFFLYLTRGWRSLDCPLSLSLSVPLCSDGLVPLDIRRTRRVAARSPSTCTASGEFHPSRMVSTC